MDVIDFRSDTVTRPSDQMRRAVADARLGDDVYGEDPTVKDLEERVSELLAKEASLFFPTDTMANQVAVKLHTEPGDLVVCDEQSRAFRSDERGLSERAGVEFLPVDGGSRGTPRPDQISAAYRKHEKPSDSKDVGSGGIGLLILENTHEARGGLAIDPGEIREAAEAATGIGIPTHLDGGRLWNAAVALNVSLDRFTDGVDSVMVSISKGLGAPVGSVLAGDEIFIKKARQIRKEFGGGLRQAGIIAAPGIEALDNIERLRTDHEMATLLANGLNKIENISVSPPETNMVIAEIEDMKVTSDEFLGKLEENNILASKLDENQIRLVTHRDIDKTDIDITIERIQAAI